MCIPYTLYRQNSKMYIYSLRKIFALAHPQQFYVLVDRGTLGAVHNSLFN